VKQEKIPSSARPSLRCGLTLAGLLGIAAISSTQGLAQGVVDGNDAVITRSNRDPAKELAMKITEPFTFAAVGDVWTTRAPVGGLDDPNWQSLLKIMRAADMTYANMEGPIIDHAAYDGPRVGSPRYTFLALLKDMGIRMMTTANNHSYDAGAEGILMTNRFLDEAGIVHAGTGKDLIEARRPGYAGIAKGTVGVVGMYSIDASASPPPSRYSDARVGWPGVNPLHVTPYNVVTPEVMQSLRKYRDAIYARRSEIRFPVLPLPPGETPDTLKLLGALYKVGPAAGDLNYVIDPQDLNEIVRSVRTGKQVADFMVVGIHCHQNSYSFQAYSNDNHTPDFLVELAHKVIDGGADVFVGHGVHTLRGIEIYKGKPIFYGLSNFIYQAGIAGNITDPVNGSPPSGVAESTHQDGNQEVLLTTSRYEGGKLVEVRLYPTDLGIEQRPLSRSDVSRAASPAVAQRILKLMQELSRPFGTTIAVENNVGVIRVASGGPPASN
jgi:hypothetical protein